MKRRVGLLAAVAGLGLIMGSPAWADCKLNQIMEMPVTMVGSRPTVTLLVNGQPARFLVDSGSWASVIDSTAAKALGLKLAKTDTKSRGVGGDVDLYFTTINSLAISKDVSLGQVNMLASVDVGGSGYVGLIGENILGFADIEYDLPHGAIRFFKQQGCQGANLGYWSDGSAVEIDLTHTGKLPESRDRDPSHYDPGDLDRDVRAIALVNGQKVYATFDTGASASILNRSVAARAGVTPDTPGAVSVGLFGGIGSERKAAWIAPFDSFALGGERINNTRLRFGDLNRVQTDMLLGVDFFLSHRIFIANSLSKAFISYVGGPVFNFSDANLAAKSATTDSGGAPGHASADALVNQASSLTSRRDFAGAVALLDQAIALDDKRADALVLRGRAKRGLARDKEAAADFDQALALEPSNFEALLSRGAILARAGDLARARQDLDLAGRQKTPDGRARLRVAGAYEGAKSYADAIGQYDVVIAEKSTDELMVAALNGRCWDRALMKQDLDKALGDCNQALRIAPGDADALDSRALVHLRRGELDLALADYDAAIRAQPPTAITLYARAAARLKKGLKVDSDADLAAAKKLDPKVSELAKAEGIVEADFDAAPTAKP
jgi:tetratricopeptide (TPR) repeat protein/predicted aspartyl protease